MQPTHNQQDSDATDINTATAPLARCQQPPSYEAATRHPPAYATATRQPPWPSQQRHEDSEPPSYRERRFPASIAPASVTLSPTTASVQNSIVSQPAAATVTSPATARAHSSIVSQPAAAAARPKFMSSNDDGGNSWCAAFHIFIQIPPSGIIKHQHTLLYLK